MQPTFDKQKTANDSTCLHKRESYTLQIQKIPESSLITYKNSLVGLVKAFLLTVFSKNRVSYLYLMDKRNVEEDECVS